MLSYAFTVLLTPIAVGLHTGTAAVAAAFTTSIVASAAAAIPVGRWLDRRGGRGLMTAGSVLGVTAILAWSQVRQVWQLYPVFVLIGVAAAASLYEAAFPVVIANAGPRRRDQALLAVTIVAGFASSIFFPLTGWLLAHHTWRATLVILAALLDLYETAARLVSGLVSPAAANVAHRPDPKPVGPFDPREPRIRELAPHTVSTSLSCRPPAMPSRSVTLVGITRP